MNKTDQNIRKMLSDNEVDYSINPELEHNIMDAIDKHIDYSIILLKTKRKVKIGLIVSLVLFIAYIGVIYFEIFTVNDYSQLSFKAFYPSIFTIIVVGLVYFEMTFGFSALRNKHDNLK